MSNTQLIIIIAASAIKNREQVGMRSFSRRQTLSFLGAGAFSMGGGYYLYGARSSAPRLCLSRRSGRFKGDGDRRAG